MAKICFFVDNKPQFYMVLCDQEGTLLACTLIIIKRQKTLIGMVILLSFLPLERRDPGKQSEIMRNFLTDLSLRPQELNNGHDQANSLFCKASHL